VDHQTINNDTGEKSPSSRQKSQQGQDTAGEKSPPNFASSRASSRSASFSDAGLSGAAAAQAVERAEQKAVWRSSWSIVLTLLSYSNRPGVLARTVLACR
jgi:hypothetical protein